MNHKGIKTPVLAGNKLNTKVMKIVENLKKMNFFVLKKTDARSKPFI